jgi:hypothetical protein
MMPPSFDSIVSSRSPDTSGPESVRKDTRLLLVSNDAMRARRRPVALFVYYIYQLALSLVLAWPLSRSLASAFGGHPRGDAVLFDPGGWALLALRGAYDRASPALFGLLLLVTMLGAAAGLLPLSALLTSISHATPDTRAPRPRHLAPYLVATFAPLLYLLALGTALELALLAIALWAFGASREALEPRFGDARADQIAALVGLGVLLIAGVSAVLHDLARAAVVRYRASAFGAIRAALATFRRVSFRVLWSWAWRGFVALSLVAIVAFVVPHLGARGTMSLVSIALLHQLVIMARAALRASWLARALRAVDAHARRTR